MPDAPDTIYTALIKAQSEIGTIIKDKTAGGGSRTYLYADLPTVLDAIEPALHGNGLAILQPLTHVDGHPAVRTILLHTSGETIEGTVPLMCADMTDPQKVGGAITYYRRYALLAMLNQATEKDDDAADARTPRGQQYQPPATGAVRTVAQIQSPQNVPEEPDWHRESSAPRNAPQRPQNGQNGASGGYRGDNGDEPELTGGMTSGQWRMLKVQQRKNNLTDDALDDLARKEYGVAANELSKRDVSALIDSLKKD